MTRHLLSIVGMCVLLFPHKGPLLGQAVTVVPGVPVESALTASSSTFSVALTPGDFAEMTVTQPNGDLRLRAIDPSGVELLRVNMRRAAQGDERLLLVARADGLHVVHVESAGPQTGTAPFVMMLRSVRRATAADEALARALASYAAGERDASRGTAEARKRAVTSFREALQVWTSTGARFEQASALQQIAFAQLQAGDLSDAAANFDDAARLRREIGDRYGEAVALHNLASTQHRRGEYTKAMALYADALRLRREVGDRGGEAWSLIGQGSTDAIVNNGWKATLPTFQQALEIFREVEDRRGEAEALYYLGYAQRSIGEFERGLELFAAALALRREQNDYAGQASALNQIVAVHLALGDAERVLDLIDDILALRRRAGDRRGEAYSLQTAAMAAEALEQYPRAIDSLEAARRLFDAVGDREGQASALLYLARVHLATGDPQRAREIAGKALEVGPPRNLITPALLSLAGRADYALGKYDQAAQHHDRALAEARRLGQPVAVAAALSGLGRTAYARHRLEEATKRLQEAIDLIESVRGRVSRQDLRSSLLALTQPTYDWAVEALMERHRTDPSAGYAAEAFAVNERRRARTLLELLAEARADVRTGADAALIEREGALQQRLNERSGLLMAAIADGTTDDKRAELEKEIGELVAQHRAARAELRRNSPRYAALVDPEPLDLPRIQQLLDPRTLLLEYALGEERSYVWAITANTMSVGDLPGRAAIEAAAKNAHTLVTGSARRSTRAPVQRALAELSTIILKPVARQLGDKRLVIVADGALQYVPFAALPHPRRAPANAGEPLVVRHQIVVLPSASLLAQLRIDPRAPSASKRVAVLADPVVRADDPRVTGTHEVGAPPRDLVRAARAVGLADFDRLPYTRDEAMAIASMAGSSNSRMALGFDATRQLALSPEVSTYRVVHFATHTLLDTRHPELSGVVLSLVDRDGRRVDGFLRLHDIFNMRLNADLVVLSACETALGREVKGEGLIGLTRGFMYAGAPQIVASLWNVRDRATAELMRRFYSGLLERGQTAAAALQAAQVSMWKDSQWRAPVYWAGFIVQGDWRERR